MFRLLLIPVLLTAMVVGAVIWSGGNNGRDRADFAFVNRDDNKCLDPNQMSWMQDIRIAYCLWEGLYTLDPVTMKPVLGTADRADVDPTKTVWTLHIRPDAKWSNGDPVVANDFLFSWRRFLETPGDYTYLHYYIKGAREYSEAYQAYIEAKSSGATTQPTFDIHNVGEAALDDHTIRVTLNDPVPFFPALLSFTPFFPMHEPSMRPFAITNRLTGATTYNQSFTSRPFDPAHPKLGGLVGNGPYRLQEWSFKRRVRMVANDYYWNPTSVKSKTIDEVSAINSMAAFRAYERGDVDWLSDADYDVAEGLLKSGGRTDLHIYPAFGTYFYSFNCLPKLPGGRDNPLADRRVRRALVMAIDKDAVAKTAGRLGQPPTSRYVPINTFDGYHSPSGLPFDPAKARALLAEAGYPDGKGFPALGLLYNNEANHADVAQVVRRQWLTNLNINVNLEGVEVKVFGERLHSQDYDIARASWFGDYDDPSTFSDKYKSDSDNNDSKWANPEYDALCASAAKEIDPQKRLDLLAKAENILLEDAPIMPLYYYVNIYMFRDNVKGLPMSPNAMQMFQSIYVDRGMK